MPAIPLPVLASFLASMFSQFAGLALLPATRGFTAPLPTIGCILAFMCGIAISARMIYNGMEMSILVPLMTVALQLFTVAVGISVYGESGSFAKVALLVGSALMIGAATRV